MPLRIGLTGGIGSGKSTVAGMFARRGANIVDTDAIARRLTQSGGAAMPAVRQAFGETIALPDGSLDRDAMRALAFSNTIARKTPEAILHPMIGAESAREALASASHVVLIDVPLLVESQHWRERVDRVLVVDCTAATQIERVVKRPGWTRDAAERVIANQAARPVRRAIADAVIFNDNIGLDALDAAVETLWHHWHLWAKDAVEQ